MKKMSGTATVNIKATLPLVDIEGETSSPKYYGMAAMHIVNKTMYCIRTLRQGKNESKALVYLYKITGDWYNENPSSVKTQVIGAIHTSSGSKNVAQHANSLCHVSGNFYMATKNEEGSAVLAFDSNGLITNHISCTVDEVHTISYEGTRNGNLCFLIKTGKKTTSGKLVYRFRLFELVDNKLTLCSSKAVNFTVSVDENGLDAGNDVWYDRQNKKLYVTSFGTVNGKIKNVISVYEVGDMTKSSYTAVRNIVITGAGLEIEGMRVYSDNGKKYVCIKRNPGCQDDVGALK